MYKNLTYIILQQTQIIQLHVLNARQILYSKIISLENVNNLITLTAL